MVFHQISLQIQSQFEPEKNTTPKKNLANVAKKTLAENFNCDS